MKPEFCFVLHVFVSTETHKKKPGANFFTVYYVSRFWQRTYPMLAHAFAGSRSSRESLWHDYTETDPPVSSSLCTRGGRGLVWWENCKCPFCPRAHLPHENWRTYLDFQNGMTLRNTLRALWLLVHTRGLGVCLCLCASSTTRALL